jgi:hypothetical protein
MIDDLSRVGKEMHLETTRIRKKDKDKVGVESFTK